MALTFWASNGMYMAPVKTSMHSSRMCTDRTLTIVPVCYGEVVLSCGEVVLSWGGAGDLVLGGDRWSCPGGGERWSDIPPDQTSPPTGPCDISHDPFGVTSHLPIRYAGGNNMTFSGGS